jgi:hypothetical protein
MNFPSSVLNKIFSFFDANETETIHIANLISKSWNQAEKEFWKNIFKANKLPEPNDSKCLFSLKEIWWTIIKDKGLLIKYPKCYKNLWSTKFEKNDWNKEEKEWKLITLNELIRNLFVSDLNLVEPFLFTFPAFTNDYVVLMKIFEIFNAESEANHKELQLFVVSMIKKWVHLNVFPSHLLKKLSKFKEFTTDKNFIKFFEETQKKKLTRNENNFVIPSIHVPMKKIYHKTLSDVSDIDVHDFTEQFTLRSFDSYSFIKREDVLRFPSGGNSLSYVFKLSEQTERVSTWICYEILREFKLAARQRKLKFFIECAFQFYKTNNYSDSFAFFSGITNSYITSLSATFTLERKLQNIILELESIFVSENKFEKYKAHLSEIPVEVPCLPYLGIVTNDLMLNLDGAVNTDYLIDWGMKREECSIVKKYLQYQSQEYKYTRISVIQAFISRSLYNPSFPTDKEMFQLAKERKAAESENKRKSASSLKEMLTFSSKLNSK